MIQIITKIDSTKYQLINTFIGFSPVIILQLHQVQARVVKFNIKIYPARKVSQAQYLSLILCKTLKDHEVNNEYLMYYILILYNVSQPMIKDPYILYWGSLLSHFTSLQTSLSLSLSEETSEVSEVVRLWFSSEEDTEEPVDTAAT